MIKTVKSIYRKDLDNLSNEEAVNICEREGLVYLGKNLVISKEDYDLVLRVDQAIRYGDNPYED